MSETTTTTTTTTEEFPGLCGLLALSAHGVWASVSALVSGSHCRCVWVLLVEYDWISVEMLRRNSWFDSGYMFCVSFERFFDKFHHFFDAVVDSYPAVLSPFSRRTEKRAQLMLHFAVFFALLTHGNLDIISTRICGAFFGLTHCIADFMWSYTVIKLRPNQQPTTNNHNPQPTTHNPPHRTHHTQQNNRTTEPQNHRTTDQQTNRPTDQQTNRPTDQQTNRPTDQQTNRPTDNQQQQTTTRRYGSQVLLCGSFFCDPSG